MVSHDPSVSHVQCLRDSALPVQIEAASSLRYLIELDEAEEPVLQVLPDILNEYFRIMQEIGLDEVGHLGKRVMVCTAFIVALKI